MNPLRALPWLLLAASLVAHAWTFFLHEPARSRATPARAEFASAPAHDTPPPAPPPAVASTETASPAPPISHSSFAIRHSADDGGSAVIGGYVDLLARSLDTAEQHDDLARALARWVAVDPVAAADWLNRQPDDPRFDLPVTQLAVLLVARGDYARAREWAGRLVTPEARASAFEEILAEQYRHRRLTEPALRAAAARDGLPPERVRAILDYSRLD